MTTSICTSKHSYRSATTSKTNSFYVQAIGCYIEKIVENTNIGLTSKCSLVTCLTSELIQSTPLPKDMSLPTHAVETSVGNIIIIQTYEEEDVAKNKENSVEEEKKNDEEENVMIVREVRKRDKLEEKEGKSRLR